MASHDLASFSGGNFCEEEKSLAPPLFEGTNYKGWKILIEKFIKSLDIEVWNLAIARPANESNKKELQLNAKAKHYLFCGLSNEIFKLIFCFSSAYKVWRFLEEMYDSPSTGMEQSQEPENMQACTSLQESSSLDESMEHTSNEKEEEVLSSEEELQKDVICSNRASPESNVKKSNPIFCTSISSLQVLQTTNRKIKKLKKANKYLRIENKNLKAKLNEESNSNLSSSTHNSVVENIIPCVEYNDIKEKFKELEKEIIFIKEQNEKLCLENSSLINDCAKCKEYKIEIQEMDETFDEFRNEYQNHIDSIVSTLKNSTIAYNKARHNFKLENDELKSKINLLMNIINTNSQNQTISKSKLNTNINNGNKKQNVFEKPNYHYLQNHVSPNLKLKLHKFPINNTINHNFQNKENRNGNLMYKSNKPRSEWKPKVKEYQKFVNEIPKHYPHHLQYQSSPNLNLNANKFPINNVKPRFEWRPKVKDETQTRIKRAHSILSPQKKTRCIWVPKGTVTPGPLWIPKSLIH